MINSDTCVMYGETVRPLTLYICTNVIILDLTYIVTEPGVRTSRTNMTVPNNLQLLYVYDHFYALDVTCTHPVKHKSHLPNSGSQWQRLAVGVLVTTFLGSHWSWRAGSGLPRSCCYSSFWICLLCS